MGEAGTVILPYLKKWTDGLPREAVWERAVHREMLDEYRRKVSRVRWKRE
jgi:hypothetical protein